MSLGVLHPITIHLPLTLGFFQPFLIVFLIWKTKFKGHRRLFVDVMLLSTCVLFLSSGFSYWTGIYDAAQGGYSRSQVENHQTAAQWLLAANLLGFVIALAAKVVLSRLTQVSQDWLPWVMFLHSIGQLYLVVWVGHLGGRIVFG